MDIEKYLSGNNAKKQIDKLAKKCKNKKVIFYGAGKFFRTIKDNYDLSKFNVVGISDTKYTKNPVEKDFGYTAIPYDELADTDFDVVIMTIFNGLSCLNEMKRVALNKQSKFRKRRSFLFKNISKDKINTKVKIYPMILPTFSYLFKMLINK